MAAKRTKTKLKYGKRKPGGRPFTGFTLDPKTIVLLDAIKKRTGRSRSLLIDQAVRELADGFPGLS